MIKTNITDASQLRILLSTIAYNDDNFISKLIDNLSQALPINNIDFNSSNKKLTIKLKMGALKQHNKNFVNNSINYYPLINAVLYKTLNDFRIIDKCINVNINYANIFDSLNYMSLLYNIVIASDNTIIVNL